MQAVANSTEIHIVAWSVILLLVHIVIQTLFVVKDAGLGYAMSNRTDAVVLSPMTDRLTRGLRNFVETYAAFIGLALALAITGKTGGLAATGALIWFWARVVYVPVFAAGIPGLRTVVWAISIVGMVLMLVQLMH